MFSGIVEEAALVSAFEARSAPAALVVESVVVDDSTRVGDSICIDGVCLTVLEHKGRCLRFELAPETLRRSALGSLAAGRRVNLERSLKVDGRVHGHFVFGHVDGVAKLLARTRDGECVRLAFELPSDLSPLVAPKGSISVSGVSLTVGEVKPGEFSVYLLPYTLRQTTLGELQVGEQVNLEVDMLARYVQRLLAAHEGAGGSHLGEEFLREHGYLK